MSLLDDSRKEPRLRLAHGAEKELLFGGIPWLGALFAAILWPGILTILIALVLTLLFAVLLYFFRDPPRVPPADADAIVAPADGKVIQVERVDAAPFLNGPALKISIFMSLFDVHVNRAPVAGRVALIEHVPGQFLQAFRPAASEVNEHNLIGLESAHGNVLVKQVAGVLARRVVCWVRPAQVLQAGERLGVIKFGSRVDLFLPSGAEPAIKAGAHTRAGETVVARWKVGSW